MTYGRPNSDFISSTRRSLNHLLCYARKLKILIRHNKIQDTFAKIKHDVCYDVEVEPTLQLLKSESLIIKTNSTDENAQLDNKANVQRGSKFNRYFFVVKIFYPLAN